MFSSPEIMNQIRTPSLHYYITFLNGIICRSSMMKYELFRNILLVCADGCLFERMAATSKFYLLPNRNYTKHKVNVIFVQDFGIYNIKIRSITNALQQPFKKTRLS